jgi:acetyl esterase/lipase
MKLSKVAPELRNLVRWMPNTPVRTRIGRAITRAMVGLIPAVEVPGVSVEIIESENVRLRLYRPEVSQSDAALLWIHGGGYLMGRAIQDDKLCGITARECGITVVSTEYRVAPEHPFPAALDDCLAAWNWLQASAAQLGVDPARVAIGGQSAGGGLAACLVQRVHDDATSSGSGNEAIAQWLLCPMLDDRTATLRRLDGVRHILWTNHLNAVGWRSYLGHEPGEAQAAPYAVAARRTDLANLPPAWIGVGDIDLFHEECVAYAQSLQDSGVDVTLRVTPGGPHAFESWGSRTNVAQAHLAASREWLRATLAT